jgi:ElaB/YqjD/DUF883 family membrane-anchored ribosome-binding protein
MNDLKQRSQITPKLQERYKQFEQLLEELEGRDLSDDIVAEINKSIEQLNKLNNDEVAKKLHKIQTNITEMLEKKAGLVTKNHFQNTWTAMGMLVFGLPIGLAFGTGSNNMAWLSIGLPLGLVIGMMIGRRMDRKAAIEGRQLNIELK